MKRKKRILGVLMIVAALIIMQLPVSEADAATSASDFLIEGGTLIKYRGGDKKVTIPDTVEVIGESAFEENRCIEQVIIPKSVKRIDPYAFWWCDNLNTVTLGTGLTEVGDYAFAGCTGLTRITIPDNIISIGINAFSDCVNLKDITIPPETYYIHETAFENCYQLKIHCEKGSAADQYAEWFYEHQKEMGEYQDTSGYDPSNPAVSTPRPSAAPPSAGETQLGESWVVGNGAFVFADNTKFHVYDGGAYLKTETEPLAGLMDDFTNGIPKFTVVDGEVIADQAYYRSGALRTVRLPEGIKEIGQFAFARSSITRLTVPEGTADIGYGAFYHCDYLTDVSLPESIMCVEPKAFEYTAWVTDFMNGGSQTEGSFLIEGGVLVAYRGDSDEVVIPEGVRVIAGEVFAGHTEITAVELPYSLRVIGEGAFENCSALLDIWSGEGLEEIKDRAFQNTAISRESFVLPATVKKLGVRAFGDAELFFDEGMVELTHETSAERLSNVSCRVYPTGQSGAKGVTVRGVEHAAAFLEGAADSYTLTVTVPESAAAMKKACVRAFGESMPEDMAVYDLTLTDSSGIPLTKLGTQTLTVVLPVPEQLKGKNLKLLALDRNGQAEGLTVERVTLDGVESVRFQVRHLSLFGLYGAGLADADQELTEVSVELNSMSAAPQPAEAVSRGRVKLKFMAGGALLLTGLLVLLTSITTIKTRGEKRREKTAHTN